MSPQQHPATFSILNALFYVHLAKRFYKSDNMLCFVPCLHLYLLNKIWKLPVFGTVRSSLSPSTPWNQNSPTHPVDDCCICFYHLSLIHLWAVPRYQDDDWREVWLRRAPAFWTQGHQLAPCSLVTCSRPVTPVCQGMGMVLTMTVKQIKHRFLFQKPYACQRLWVRCTITLTRARVARWCRKSKQIEGGSCAQQEPWRWVERTCQEASTNPGREMDTHSHSFLNSGNRPRKFYTNLSKVGKLILLSCYCCTGGIP
jgi:hypothetical protein